MYKTTIQTPVTLKNGKKVIFEEHTYEFCRDLWNNIKEFAILPICSGKYCENTKNLKLEKGWYRYHFKVEDMIKEQLFCEECIKEYTISKCKGCSETYKYTEMEYRDGGAFGEALYGHDDFFCKPCIVNINNVEYDPDEWC